MMMMMMLHGCRIHRQYSIRLVFLLVTDILVYGGLFKCCLYFGESNCDFGQNCKTSLVGGGLVTPQKGRAWC